MQDLTYVTQPRAGAVYTDLFRRAFSHAPFQTISIAVAYATLGGIFSVRDAINMDDDSTWNRLNKRWVVGIDWCRSEPSALSYIAKQYNSQSRVFDGQSLVERQGCVPSTPFHPKVFILHTDDTTAVICGSANLSLSGQTKGHEVGSLFLFMNPGSKKGNVPPSPISEISAWFEHVWDLSAPVNVVLQPYMNRFELREHLQSPIPTVDDVNPLAGSKRRALSERQLRQLRACRRLWVQAGNLHSNRGLGLPGNQLMLSAFTRVFFGIPAIAVPRDTRLGYVRIEFQGDERSDCALRYSNNAMDVLGLPIPGTEGPLKYDRETLLFEQEIDQQGVKYILRVGSAADRNSWLRKSRRISGDYKMTSGRQWGVF